MNVLLAPHVTEKTIAWRCRSTTSTRSACAATPRAPRCGPRSSSCSTCKVASVQVVNEPGKTRRFGKHTGPHAGLEEGLRAAGRRPEHRLRGRGRQGLRVTTMALIKLKPTSPGTRFVVRVTAQHLHKGGPHEALTAHQNKTGARNHVGRITTRHIGGGSRQKYRMIDFRRDKDGIRGVVERLEYDPNRTSHIALILLRRRRASLHPRPQGPEGRRRSALGRRFADQAGQRDGAAPHPGRARMVHNIELKPGRGGQLARSAGNSAQYTAREGIVRLPAPEVRRDAQGARRLPRHASARSATTSTTCASTARPAPSAGAASARRCAAWS